MCGDRSLTRDDELEVEFLDRERFLGAITHMSKVEGAFVLANVRKDASREGIGRFSRPDTGMERPEVSTRKVGDCHESILLHVYIAKCSTVGCIITDACGS